MMSQAVIPFDNSNPLSVFALGSLAKCTTSTKDASAGFVDTLLKAGYLEEVDEEENNAVVSLRM